MTQNEIPVKVELCKPCKVQKPTFIQFTQSTYSEDLEIPAHVWTALEAGGITKQDLPEWTPTACQVFLLMVKKLYLGNFTMRGGLGYHGINCPDEWPPEFSTAVQSVYARAMQCSGDDWGLFLDIFDGMAPF
ncbi:MAG: hypothetical protein RBR42_09365 [Desulfomicrobium sp.]|nr:hypothetical protein [Desulfomicrobium sp.]